MRNNSVVIATNAIFLADLLKEKLSYTNLKVYVAGNDSDLAAKMKSACPKFIFLENCFNGYGTDVYVQRTARHHKGVRIAVWAVSEVKPVAAARFIMAGADSFFSLRDSEKNIQAIVWRIASGQPYCPADVKALLDKDRACAVIGEGLTSREKEIIKMSADGKTNREIGNAMSLTVHTVKYHKANIYRKCGGNTVVDILVNGIRRGVVDLDEIG